MNRTRAPRHRRCAVRSRARWRNSTARARPADASALPRHLRTAARCRSGTARSSRPSRVRELARGEPGIERRSRIKFAAAEADKRRPDLVGFPAVKRAAVDPEPDQQLVAGEPVGSRVRCDGLYTVHGSLKRYGAWKQPPQYRPCQGGIGPKWAETGVLS